MDKRLKLTSLERDILIGLEFLLRECFGVSPGRQYCEDPEYENYVAAFVISFAFSDSSFRRNTPDSFASSVRSDFLLIKTFDP